MSSQFFIINMTNHHMCLKTHKPHTLKWMIDADSAHGWSLPNDADHDTKFKIKHDGKVIANLWIDRNGVLTGIKNNSDKFLVMGDDARHDRFDFGEYLDISRRSDASATHPHTHKPATIIIKHVCH